MSTTPEGRVKREVMKWFARCQQAGMGLHVFRPVQTGFGKRGLDFHCVVNGQAFFIETKEPGKWLTPLQRQTAVEMLAAGASVFVVSTDEGLGSLSRWMLKAARIPVEVRL